MIKWYCLAAIGAAAVVVGAKAQDQGQPGIVFDGTARTGNNTRPVHFRFFCSSNSGPNVTGVLAVELEIPRYEELRAVFDISPFEGPDANVGPLTLLRANGARMKASERFTAAGSVVPRDGAEFFMLGVDASRREPGPLQKLAAVLRPLTDGPGWLEWQQGNAKPGHTPMNASLELGQPQPAQWTAGLCPCLGAR
jgi:hypothetical protein